MRTALDFPADQPGCLQDLDVFRRGCQRHVVGGCQLSDSLPAASKSRQHLPARGVAQSLENRIDLMFR